MTYISPAAKLLLGGAVLAGILAYVVILDVGVNAGVIHHGVRIGHLDVGRMTQSEARATVKEAGATMLDDPIVFTADGLPPIVWTARELGWEPRPRLMAERAMDVGRRHDLSSSIGDRLRAWWRGVTITWDDPDPRKVMREVDRVADAAASLGLEVDEARLQALIHEAVLSWPRDSRYEIPMQ